MKILWVLENIKKHRSFYGRFDLSMMFASVIQWKKHHPEHYTELHVDKRTKLLFKRMGVLELWDNVVDLPNNKFIDKSVFWASSKLQVLRNVTTPIVIMDNDFLIYKPFDSFLKNKPVVAHDEEGQDYYLGPLDEYLKRVKHIINRPKLKAINCSFLYLPDYKFTQHYAQTSLQLMTELTELKAPNSKYLIYSEQLLLKHLLDQYKVPYATLIDREYKCSDETFSIKSQGIIPYEDSHRYFRHYWKEKKKIKENTDGFEYDEEINTLENIIKNRILIDWTIINDRL